MGEDRQEGDRFEVDGNRLRLLLEGPERLEALVELIDGAQESLRLLYYIYAEDAAGHRILDALRRAVERGVAVTLIVDGFGCAAPDGFFQPLEDAGAKVCRFEPRWGRRYLLRNHQKLALADKRRIVIGGFNVEDDYFEPIAAGGWRDLGLELDGPAAARLADYFDALHDWVRTPNARFRTLRDAIRRYSETDGRVRWLLGGPTRRLSPWAQSVREDMRVARDVDMIAAYFTPTPGILRRIEETPRTPGVTRVVTAAKSDSEATIAAARHTYTRLLRAGVRIFEYQPAKLHTKLFVADRTVHLGSANFDVRSLFLNLELMLRVEDERFARRMRDYVDSECRDAIEVTREAHEQSSWLSRLRWSLAYFAVAILDANVTRRLNFGIDGR